MESRVRLNVGGEIFETSLTTLERAGRDSFLGALLDPLWRTQEETLASGPGTRHEPAAYPPEPSPLCQSRQWTSAPNSPLIQPLSATSPLGPSYSSTSPAGSTRSCSDPCLCQKTQELSLARGILGPLKEDSPLKLTKTPSPSSLAAPSGLGAASSFEGLPSSAVSPTPATITPGSSHVSSHVSSGSVRRSILMDTPSSVSSSVAPHSTPVRTENHNNLNAPQAHHHTPQYSPYFGGSCPHLGYASPSFLPPRPRQPKQPMEIFLDRDPAVFRVLLNLLRTGHLDLSSGISQEALLGEADFLGLQDCVKGALMPPQLDANEMEKVTVLSPNVGPTEICTAMCGNEDGSLTVAHGSRITAYDWSLDRVATIFTELPQVDTIAHLSESLIVVAGAKSCEQLPVYSLHAPSPRQCQVDAITCTGASHPCYRSVVCSDRFLFIASLRKSLGAEWGVGKAVAVVDRETLKSVGEPGPAPLTTKRMSGPDKLQWIESRNLLLVAKRYSVWPPGGHESASYVRLWDPRCNQVVWDWREYEEPQVGNIPSDRWYALCDAVVCEDLDLLFKASPTSASDVLSSRLSAIDLRCLSSSPTSGTATTISPSATSFLTGPMSPSTLSTGSLSSGSSIMPPPPQDRSFATGHDSWSVLQWQKSEGLRIGAPTRERYENSVLRLVAVPGSGQVICNRQPTLEVWSPVAQMGLERRAERHGEADKGQEKSALDPFMFRRSYANSREEYNRKRTSGGDMNSWVYDMTLAGDHRLFVAREENKEGSVDYSSIEVWETKRSGLPRRMGVL